MNKNKTREITIKISEIEMDAVEDAFFTSLEHEPRRWGEVKPLLVRVWKKLCIEMDKEEKKIPYRKKATKMIIVKRAIRRSPIKLKDNEYKTFTNAVKNRKKDEITLHDLERGTFTNKIIKRKNPKRWQI